MNLYLISQSAFDLDNHYDSAVVAAEDEAAARATHPGGDGWNALDDVFSTWVRSDELHLISVKLLGAAFEAVAAGVICAHFNERGG